MNNVLIFRLTWLLGEGEAFGYSTRRWVIGSLGTVTAVATSFAEEVAVSSYRVAADVRILRMKNTFWIAANIIFEMATGKTSEVLMLVSRESDATVFATEREAETFLRFVEVRAQTIRWFLDPPTPQRPNYVIRGEQTRTGG
ncbi:MAG: hypothetical protein ABSD98_10290 [Candidatus Korobacteraceae bacterium]|jgi:hypothetical protein